MNLVNTSVFGWASSFITSSLVREPLRWPLTSV
jgi:hypothetical protein